MKVFCESKESFINTDKILMLDCNYISEYLAEEHSNPDKFIVSLRQKGKKTITT